jgi:hypothetical protein
MEVFSQLLLHYGLCTKKHLLATTSIPEPALRQSFRILRYLLSERTTLVPGHPARVNVRILLSIQSEGTSHPTTSAFLQADQEAYGRKVVGRSESGWRKATSTSGARHKQRVLFHLRIHILSRLFVLHTPAFFRYVLNAHDC